MVMQCHAMVMQCHCYGDIHQHHGDNAIVISSMTKQVESLPVPSRLILATVTLYKHSLALWPDLSAGMLAGDTISNTELDSPSET